MNNHKYQQSDEFDMEGSSDDFDKYFENLDKPLFIVDLQSYKVINVNQKFIVEQSSFEDSLDQYRSYLEKSKDTGACQFGQEGKIFLFNPIFQNEGKLLIQILELSGKINNSFADKPIQKHPFEQVALNKKLLNKLPSGIIHTNKNFESIWFNEKFGLLFGRKTEANFNFIDAIYMKNISKFWAKIEELSEIGGTVEFSFAIHDVKHSDEVFIDATAFSVGKDLDLEEGFIFILEDKTENLNFSDEITKQNLALNQINHELDKFLYSVSHNIRGPIASLEGLLKVIEISDVKTVNELKHHLRLNLRLLNSFVSDISNVATNIHTHVSFEKVNLRYLIEQMLLFVDDIYEVSPKIAIDIPIPYFIRTDPNRLGIIIKCLLKNSFQYRDSGKEQLEIKIKVTSNEDFHLIEFTDNGIGISDKVKPFIFDMFYRGTELSNGNGMGLYNSREILKKLGGTINIDSQEREWTNAKIYLPVEVS